MASRLKCKHCGRGFIAPPWSRNGQTMTCKRATCEKKSGIYSKPTMPNKIEALPFTSDRLPDRTVEFSAISVESAHKVGKMLLACKAGDTATARFDAKNNTQVTILKFTIKPTMTPSQMGKKSAAAMTPAERSARAKKASNAARKKYGKDRMKQVRAGKTFAKKK
jgi:hypothetical protein